MAGDLQLDQLAADNLADRVARQFFSILGVAIDDPRQIEEFRDDLRFARKLRRAADHGFLAFIGVVVMAVSAAIWAGVVSLVGKH